MILILSLGPLYMYVHTCTLFSILSGSPVHVCTSMHCKYMYYIILHPLWVPCTCMYMYALQVHVLHYSPSSLGPLYMYVHVCTASTCITLFSILSGSPVHVCTCITLFSILSGSPVHVCTCMHCKYMYYIIHYNNTYCIKSSRYFSYASLVIL